MHLKKIFIDAGIQTVLISEFVGRELNTQSTPQGYKGYAGYAGLELQKTPMGTRITIRTSRPGIVIGKKGSNVKALTQAVKNHFNIEVSTIDVEAIEVPELNAQIQAEKIAIAIEKGQNYRRATYSIVRRIMRSGARGVEIHISGKVTSQRARVQVFRAGIISKCGIPAIEGVDYGVAHLTQKSGVIGIRVKIMPDSYQMPDEVKILEGIFERKQEEKKKDEPDEYWEKSQKATEKPDEDALFDDTSAAKDTILQSAEEDEESKKPETTETPEGEKSA
ncbi:MAG: 30S ribosomal protein S3 [Promethearchaeota archaeon]